MWLAVNSSWFGPANFLPKILLRELFDMHHFDVRDMYNPLRYRYKSEDAKMG